MVPADRAATSALQMVWGPGTFGYSPTRLADFKREQCPGINLDKVHFDTKNHGTPGGDNFGEGSLDVSMITSFGMNATTLVSNTNASISTEEGDAVVLSASGEPCVDAPRRRIWCVWSSDGLLAQWVRS